MDNSISIRVTGAKELRRAAKKVAGKETNAVMKKGHHRVSSYVSDHAKGGTRTPTRSGALRSSIKASPTSTKARVQAGSGKSRDYAGVQHYGDPKRGIPATEFLTESVSDTWKVIANTYEEFIEELGDLLRTKGL